MFNIGAFDKALSPSDVVGVAWDGAEGEFSFDAKGDGLHGYNVVRNDAGRIVFVRRFEFAA